MRGSTEILILHGLVSPYKTLLFNALYDRLGERLRVVYLAENAQIRDWAPDYDSIRFPYDLLFEGNIDELSQFTMAKATVTYLNRVRPKALVIAGYDFLANWAALAWAKIHRVPCVIVSETHKLDRPRNFPKETVKKVFLAGCDAALVAGERHRQYLVGLGFPDSKVFIYHGVGGFDGDFYLKTFAALEENRGEFRKTLGIQDKCFLYVGRLSPEKNLQALLGEFARLKADGAEQWQLVLVGDGPQRAELEERVSREKIPDVKFPGFKVKEELLQYYAAADVFVLPSLSEPWGLVVDEAMAAGLPVIVSQRCGCYPDIVNDGTNGHSFDPEDTGALHRLMRGFVDGDFDLRKMGTASKDIIRERTPALSAEVFNRAVDFVRTAGS
jgi:1,2-diacylglycerol 3-alpha-glucosyltransferase